MVEAVVYSGPPAELTLDNLFEFPDGKPILTCIQCGTCAATCPYGDVMEYPPRRVIAMLRAGWIDKVLATESLLGCVDCYACMAKCPRNIKLTEVLLPLVKERALLLRPTLPPELHKALENTLRYGNPMGESPRKRAAWTAKAGVPVRILSQDPRPVDVLWFVECYNSYHPRGQDSARAIARIFHRTGVDFAILGNEEKCAGESPRLVGESGLFETLVDYNLAIFQKYRFNRLVTNGAHGFDALHTRYAALGLRQPVEHITSFLVRHLDSLQPLLTKEPARRITYHDSCVLGRHNGLFDEPRRLLESIPGVKLVEMVHNRVNSICCGAGGGGMWLDTYFKSKGYERLSERRMREALKTGADVLAVSCPFEVSRFEDAAKVLGCEKSIQVRDVVELLAEAMEE